MTFEEALKLAQDYAKVRKQVRKALLTELRLLDDVDRADSTSKVGQGRVLEPSERRKLNGYPSDLTDQRLLDMIVRFHVRSPKGQS